MQDLGLVNSSLRCSMQRRWSCLFLTFLGFPFPVYKNKTRLFSTKKINEDLSTQNIINKENNVNNVGLDIITKTLSDKKRQFHI